MRILASPKLRLLAGTSLYALYSVASLAQEQWSPATALDKTKTQEAANALGKGLEEILTLLGPIVLGVVLVGVGIWAIPRIVGIFKSAFSSGKGR